MNQRMGELGALSSEFPRPDRRPAWLPRGCPGLLLFPACCGLSLPGIREPTELTVGSVRRHSFLSLPASLCAKAKGRGNPLHPPFKDGVR